MAILKIVTDPDPLLRKTSREVSEMTPRLLTLLDDMKDTLHKAEGVGLAAVQVGILRRIVLVETEPGQLYEMINPVITKVSEEKQLCREGCLSVPGICGEIERPLSLTVEYLDRNMKKHMLEAEGFLAEAINHECDHLDGILYTDKVIGDLIEN